MMRHCFEDWLQDEMLRVQRGADVGERMENALEEMFRMGAEKAVVVGTDIPGLHKGIIDRAFQYLDSADLIIGPAMDGDTISRAKSPQRFSGIVWGMYVFKNQVNRKSVTLSKLENCLMLTDGIFSRQRDSENTYLICD
jgi:glycosyltransferase A (GT-A) superfamily protein (DUF2064 family)